MFFGLIQDTRYALRGIRRAPLFAATASATIGLGLGLLCSAFTVVNAYVLRPIDLPDPLALVGISWESEAARRHRFSWNDVEALRAETPHLSGVAAGTEAVLMRDGSALPGLLVTDDYFAVLGARAALGRTLRAGDDEAGNTRVVVLSDRLWRTQYGANPAVVGSTITLGRNSFIVIGVMPPDFGPAGTQTVAFWAPLASAAGVGLVEPRRESDAPQLWVIGRLRIHDTSPELSAWLEVWLDRRYPKGSPDAPRAVIIESLATRILLNDKTLALLTVILSSFGLVLLVACANVTNLMLARALARQRELAVRLSLGASRWRIARQLTIESLVLAAPAAGMAFAMTLATVRVFPALVIGTFPDSFAPIEAMLVPLDPDLRVTALLCAGAVASAMVVALAPAMRMARIELSRASRGEAAWDTRRSRLRTGLVAMQIGACLLFLVGATALVDETRRLANADSGLGYERVASVRLPDRLRVAVAARLASDPNIEDVGAAWESPMSGPLPTVNAVASESRIARPVGFTVVSPEYFSLFDVRLVRGRVFTAREADENAPVALISASTARILWPGLDPIGRTLDLRGTADRQPRRLPQHRSVRVIGVVEDVSSGSLLDGLDISCAYFPTGIGAVGPMSLLVRGRSDNLATLREAVTAAVNGVEPDTAFQFFALQQLVGAAAWVFGALSTTASILGVVGLLLAFSGTYAVVSLLAAQRSREFGVRMALGATVSNIVSGMLKDTLRTAAIGLAGGLAITMAMARLAGSITELVPVFAPRPYAIGAAIVLASTVLAALLPALRAARIDPSRALRIE
jgi:predicted permease